MAGWAYQLVAGLSFECDSWVAPADARHVRPQEDANEVAAEQVRRLVGRLQRRPEAPLFVFDAGYDPVRLQRGLEGCRAQILVRVSTPANAPKPCGRSPGSPRGRLSGRATRYPALKKAARTEQEGQRRNFATGFMSAAKSPMVKRQA